MASVRVVEEHPRDAWALRRDVLWPEREHGELDDDDAPSVVHLQARDASGAVVGTVRIDPQPCPWRAEVAASFQLRSMATAPDARGTGAGRALVEAAIGRARDAGAELLWCNAREGAVGFYERLGFLVETEGFVKDERPHIGMAIEL